MASIGKSWLKFVAAAVLTVAIVATTGATAVAQTPGTQIVDSKGVVIGYIVDAKSLKLFYPQQPFVTVPILSSWGQNQGTGQYGCGKANRGVTKVVGVAKSVNLPHFLPPFSIRQPRKRITVTGGIGRNKVWFMLYLTLRRCRTQSPW